MRGNSPCQWAVTLSHVPLTSFLGYLVLAPHRRWVAPPRPFEYCIIQRVHKAHEKTAHAVQDVIWCFREDGPCVKRTLTAAKAPSGMSVQKDRKIRLQFDPCA